MPIHLCIQGTVNRSFSGRMSRRRRDRIPRQSGRHTTPRQATVRVITHHWQKSSEGDDAMTTADDAEAEIENGSARRSRRRRHLSRPPDDRLKQLDTYLRRLLCRLHYRRLHVGHHQLTRSHHLPLRADGAKRWPRPGIRDAHSLHGERTNPWRTTNVGVGPNVQPRQR